MYTGRGSLLSARVISMSRKYTSLQYEKNIYKNFSKSYFLSLIKNRGVPGTPPKSLPSMFLKEFNAVEVPYGICGRTVWPVHFPLGTIQTLLVDRHWVIVDPSQLARNMADGRSAVSVRAILDYCKAPPQLPHRYRALVFLRANILKNKHKFKVWNFILKNTWGYFQMTNWHTNLVIQPSHWLI